MEFIDIVSFTFSACLILWLHQTFLSTSIYFIRKKNLFGAAHSLSPPWPFYPAVTIIIPIIIAALITITMVLSNYWWLSVYHVLLLIDLFILFKMEKNVLENTVIDKYFVVFPEIKYPKKILNIFFQPSWLFWIAFVIIVISILFKNQILLLI